MAASDSIAWWLERLYSGGYRDCTVAGGDTRVADRECTVAASETVRRWN
jgi:hypothetical protein